MRIHKLISYCCFTFLLFLSFVALHGLLYSRCLDLTFSNRDKSTVKIKLQDFKYDLTFVLLLE